MGMRCNQSIGTIFDNVKKVGGSLTAPIKDAARLYGSKETVAPPEWAVKMAKFGGGMGTVDPVTHNIGFSEAFERAHMTNGMYDVKKLAKTGALSFGVGVVGGEAVKGAFGRSNDDNKPIL